MVFFFLSRSRSRAKKNHFFKISPLLFQLLPNQKTMSDAAAAPSAAAPPSTSTGSKTPADFLKSIKGKGVVVKLNGGSEFRGALILFR